MLKHRKIEPLPVAVMMANVSFLSYLKDAAFHGDHPGIDRMVGEMRQELARRPEPSFMEVSFVKADIKSQWQAYFSQIFPIRMGELPKTVPGDEAFFNAHWKGSKEWNGIPMTYRNFMLLHYPGWWTGRLVVSKKSGKPFKSGLKKGTVKRIVTNEATNRPAYEMVEDGSVVEMRQCVEVG